MKNMRLFKKFAAALAAVAMVAGIAAPSAVSADEGDEPILIAPAPVTSETPDVIAPAPNQTVVSTLEDYKITKLVTLEKTVKDDETTINFIASYPYVKMADAAIAKNVRKALKSTSYSEVVRSFKTLMANDEIAKGVITVTVECDETSISRCGNILSVPFIITSEVEGGAYPVNEFKSVLIDLTTGKKVKLANLFTSSKKIRRLFAKKVMAYAESAMDSPFFSEYADMFANVSYDTVYAAIDSASVALDWCGAEIVLDETDGLWPHAVGIQTVFVKYEDFTKYIKAEKAQLFMPLAALKLTLDFNAGTGYSWNDVTDAKDNECLELIYSASYPDNTAAFGMTGGRQHGIYIFKPVKEGNAKIKMNLVRPWDLDNPADTFEQEYVITSDLFVTENNGEN